MGFSDSGTLTGSGFEELLYLASMENLAGVNGTELLQLPRGWMQL